ncbi:phasin family protein [Hymenobacter weizhouensis]|uniref:phasin family protein n=1 Tax=Hymenobacter sp. YIM 151500-1 TaxID=2987689 RepID=UPI002227126D|nr:hypothetical protein [Hymenobacter sp. YIM 151500-1]UYZ63608.1 hypothetical protein OIS53_01895 [Hymenobacter sp. YIM 151500-1]
MEDLFKKFINAGVGFVSLTNDRVQSTINKLVQESKLSEQEGAKIMDELKKNTDAKRQELEKQFQGLTSRLMKTVGVAPNSDVEDLKRTVRQSKSSNSGAAGTSASKATGSASGAKKSSTSSAAGKSASSATSKAAGAVKKAADSTSAAAGKTQKSAAAKAGAAKKDAPKVEGNTTSAGSSDNGNS